MAAIANKCQVIAIRYQFVFKVGKNNEPHIQFLPHPLINLPVDNYQSEETNEQLNPEDIEYNDDVEYLRSLDPKEWKLQDHYKVLGIEKFRFKANEQIIKTAFHKKLLKHHPDKRKALGEEIKPDDDYFTNITMAYDTLKTTQGRRAYDSVDPMFDNNLPSGTELKNDFFKTFSYYFKINSRWSEKPVVPQLGNINSSREEVDKFYSFWYNFKSWREYSYEDEEDKEKCQDREERRYVDKLNKAERQRKKKEEMSRIRTLVDLAYNNDPRIAKFKQEDKDRKLATKRAKQTAAQQKKEQEEQLRKEMLLLKEQSEAAERARIEAIRQQREAAKKALKKERKRLRDTCKANNYFTDDDDTSKTLEYVTSVEAICETYTLDELTELNDSIKNSGGSALLKAFQRLNQKKAQERQATLESTKQKTTQSQSNGILKVNPEWNEENLQWLIKAVNLFPAGTNQRWEIVANFLNQHGVFKVDNTKFTAKLVLAKAKDLQNGNFSKNNLKEQANKAAFNNVTKNRKNIEDNTNCITKKTEPPSVNGHKDLFNQEELNKKMETKESVEKTSKMNSIWTSQEQQLLEQALKTYPASTLERWDRIAECIPTRSKKECIKRYKDLVETIKAKKAAQDLGSNSK